MPEKLETYGTQDDDKQSKAKTQHNMCWTPMHTNKQKHGIAPPTNNWR
jgi:hypothetical protein